MSDAFNPYHKWLGIPPRDQPADHYRLLGIERFEENTDVISLGADQRMIFLRQFQNGKQAQLAQQLLNQIAAARVCLLDAGKKAAYDADLAQKLAESHQPISHATPPPVEDLSATIEFVATETKHEGPPAPFIDTQHSLTIAPRRSKKRGNSAAPDDSETKKRLLILAVLSGILVLLLLSILFSAGTQKTTIRPRTVQEVQIPVKEPEPSTAHATEQQPIIAKEASKEPKPQTPTNARVTLRGHIFARNAAGEEEPRETYLYLDLDGNGIYDIGAEPWLNSNAEGKYERTYPRKAIQSQTVLRLMKSPQFYQDPGAIPLSLAEAKDGVLEIATELKRKPTSIEGTLSVLPEGESAEGFVVYMDLNENDHADEEEPQTKTDGDGNYGLEFTQFDQPSPGLLKIQVSEETYLSARRLPGAKTQNGKSILSIQDANFKLTKKTAPIAETITQNPTNETSPLLDRWMEANFRKHAQKWKSKYKDQLDEKLTEVNRLKGQLQKVLTRTQSAVKKNPQLRADLKKAQKNKTEFKTKKEPAVNRIARMKKVTQALDRAKKNLNANKTELRQGKTTLVLTVQQVNNTLDTCQRLEAEILRLRNHPNTKKFIEQEDLELAPFSTRKLETESRKIDKMLKRATTVETKLNHFDFSGRR